MYIRDWEDQINWAEATVAGTSAFTGMLVSSVNQVAEVHVGRRRCFWP